MTQFFIAEGLQIRRNGMRLTRIVARILTHRGAGGLNQTQRQWTPGKHEAFPRRLMPSRELRERRSRMSILCDTQIQELIGIEPFEENIKRAGRVSYGVSSYGYDVRVGSVFKIFTNVNSEIVDPKHFSERSFVTVDTDQTGKDHVLIPPNIFAPCETFA